MQMLDWVPKAACGTSKLDFFPHEVFVDLPEEQIAPMRRICASCPVLEACLAYALRNCNSGIWGGMTEYEREAFGGFSTFGHSKIPAAMRKVHAMLHFKDAGGDWNRVQNVLEKFRPGEWRQIPKVDYLSMKDGVPGDSR